MFIKHESKIKLTFAWLQQSLFAIVAIPVVSNVGDSNRIIQIVVDGQVDVVGEAGGRPDQLKQNENQSHQLHFGRVSVRLFLYLTANN